MNGIVIPKYVVQDYLDWQVDKADLPSDRHGETRPEECQMVIASRLTTQMQRQAWWHELIHLLCAARDHDPDKKMKEEAWATFMGPALHSFFEANVEEIVWREHCL